MGRARLRYRSERTACNSINLNVALEELNNLFLTDFKKCKYTEMLLNYPPRPQDSIITD